MCLILADNGYNIFGYKNVFKTKRELIWSFFKIVIKMIVFKLMVLTEKLMIWKFMLLITDNDHND